MEESYNGIISTMHRIEINLKEISFFHLVSVLGSSSYITNVEQINKLPFFSLVHLLPSLMSEEIIIKPNFDLASSFICYHWTLPSAYRNQLTIQKSFQVFGNHSSKYRLRWSIIRYDSRASLLA